MDIRHVFVHTLLWIVLAGIALALPWQALGAGVTGAAVESVYYDPATRTANVNITGLAPKEITAFNISIDTRYSDGQTIHQERLVDMLPLMISKQEQRGSPTLGEGAFRRGEKLVESIAIDDRSPLAEVTKVDATIDVVVYLDRTVEADNARALEDLVELRRRRANTAQAAKEIITKALEDPAVTQPGAECINKLEALLVRMKAQRSTQYLGIELMGIIDDLRNSQRAAVRLNLSERGYLSQYRQRAASHSTIAAAHSQVGAHR